MKPRNISHYSISGRNFINVTRITVAFPQTGLVLVGRILGMFPFEMRKSKYSSADKVRLRLAAAGIFICCAAVFAFYPDSLVTAVQSQVRRTRSAAAARPRKYSAFPHDVKAHRIDCSSCHKFPSSNWNKVRAKDAAFPDITDYP